jgi:hypothetical protein
MSQEINLEKYHQLALQKQKEHRKIFSQSEESFNVML